MYNKYYNWHYFFCIVLIICDRSITKLNINWMKKKKKKKKKKSLKT